MQSLAGADLIACEDTRVTRKLLDRYGIDTPLTPYHDHNAETARPKLLQRLAQGAAIALVSDAGTPLDLRSRTISWCGQPRKPVIRSRHCRVLRRSLRRLTVAGLPTDQFFFAGFLPPKETGRRARIAELARIPATLVLYESGPRVAATLADLAAGLGPREAALCRELTKLHEEVRRDNLPALAQGCAAGEVRGEIVLVIAPPAAAEQPSPDEADALLRGALGRLSLKDAVGEVAEVTGLPRRELYQRALALAKEADEKRPWRDALNRCSRRRPPRQERVAAFRLGLSAESRAAMLLIAKGYRIVARRWKTPLGEVDIVARRRRTLVFVEVKARERIDDAAEAVTERGKRRIIAAAELWLAHHPDDNGRDIRFDVMLVAPGTIPRHVANAFDASR